MKPHRLGTWRCPSGNNVDGLVLGDGDLRVLACEWDDFPLSAADELYYTLVIRPAITRRVQEYLERPGRALVLSL